MRIVFTPAITYDTEDKEEKRQLLNRIWNSDSNFVTTCRKKFDEAAEGKHRSELEAGAQEILLALEQKEILLALQQEENRPPAGPALSKQLAHYQKLALLARYQKLAELSASTKASTKNHLLYGSIYMKRLEIPASLAEPTGGGYRLEIEKAADEHKPALRSLAQALYDNKIFGVYLQQVAVAREQLYFIKVETRPAADTDQPSITMTLDAVKPKDFMKDHIKVKEDPSLLDMYTKDITVYYDAQMPTKLTVTGKSWADYDKLVVTKALEYIPEADRQLLGAMKFVRVTTLPKKQGEGISEGVAEYYCADEPIICISDKVVADDYGEYIVKDGDVLPISVRMIVHEIGHAVSLEKWRQAVIANDKKTLDQIGGWNANDARPIQALQKWIADKEYVTDYAASLAIPADHPQDAKLPTVISNKAKAPAELFAEVYSLWRTNPAYLQEHHAELWKWFENDANRQRGKCD